MLAVEAFSATRQKYVPLISGVPWRVKSQNKGLILVFWVDSSRSQGEKYILAQLIISPHPFPLLTSPRNAEISLECALPFLERHGWYTPCLPLPFCLPAPQILACSSVFLLSLNATYFKHALLLTSYSKIKLLYNPFVDLSQFLLSFSMSIYDVHPDCTSFFFFFFLSMFILKISDKEKDVLKKKATLKGGGGFG